jgi:hypothetical protein
MINEYKARGKSPKRPVLDRESACCALTKPLGSTYVGLLPWAAPLAAPLAAPAEPGPLVTPHLRRARGKPPLALARVMLPSHPDPGIHLWVLGPASGRPYRRALGPPTNTIQPKPHIRPAQAPSPHPEPGAREP